MSTDAIPPSMVPSTHALEEELEGRYKVLEVIGKGGMGVVYKAKHPKLNRLVAIKVLIAPEDAGMSESGIRRDHRFEQEAQALARLSHPNIVAVHDYGQMRSGIHHLIMEYIDGRDFQMLLLEEGLTPEHALVWGRQICDGLAYAHRRGMVHRDIKPSNILIDQEGRARIADFGLVKVMGSNALETRVAFGTEGYMAPEVFVDSRNVDSRADIYSLGVLLYQMLTGKIPRGVWDPPSKLVSGLDIRFDQVIERALRQNPEERYQDVDDLKEDLDEISFSSPDGYSAAPPLSQKSLLLRLAVVFAALFAASSIGSIFNIYFNENQIGAMLSQYGGEEQRDVFRKAIGNWNSTAYPIFSLVWAGVVFSLCQIPRSSDTAKRRVVNLPWWGLAIGGAGWLLSIPVLLVQMRSLEVPPNVWLLLPMSVLVSAGIALSQGFLAVDLLSQRLLYPHFFDREEQPWRLKGAKVLSLQGRGVLWMLSSSVCPILALLLLILSASGEMVFTATVASLCIVFGLIGVWLFNRMVVQPVEEFRKAASLIEQGDLSVRVEAHRADDFGQLATEFNRMTAGLREKDELRNSLNQAASGNLAKDLLGPHAEGEVSEESGTVLVAGILDSENHESPQEMVALRNGLRAGVAKVLPTYQGVMISLTGLRLVAVFLEEESVPPSASRAIEAGKDVVKEWSRTFSNQAGQNCNLAIGIEVGEMVVTRSEGETDRDVLGQVVEQAYQVYATAREQGECLMFSETAYQASGLKEEVRPVSGSNAEKYLIFKDNTDYLS